MESIGKKKPRPRRSFTPEFKAEIVELCRRGDRSVGQVAKDFDLTETAVRDWLKQAEVDAGERDGLTGSEREELAQLRRENRRLREDVEILKRDFVFYGAPEHPDGTVRLAMDGPTEQAVTADLERLPPEIRRVVVAAAIDGAATFSDVGAVEITVTSGVGAASIARATLDAATTERTMILAEIYRRGDGWRLRAVGQGYDHGLADLAQGYGVDVSE
ncbi:TerD family protein [Streptomyces spinoverrucosus]|nr:TerD family protein [Streptomyces spinoverrucosus]